MTLSRRALVGGGAALLAGGAALDRGVTALTADRAHAAYDFFGDQQAGILTPAQDRLHFASFDVTTSDRGELVELLRVWTDAAARMTRGESVGGADSADLPPDDTGEALGLPSAGLTLTFGFGPALFRDDRFGLGSLRPDALAELPHFPGDVLDPARSGGDLCVQACADDPQVAVHAIRNLARLGFGTVSVRWSQLGFGRTSSTSRDQETPRNLFGFKDGTANVKAEDDDLDEHVWVRDGSWLDGGSYLVARRIAMTIETWDRQSLRDQEQIVGRVKGSGAPLGGREEHDEPDLARLPVDSHVHVLHPSQHGGAKMLRRGYNFVDGTTALGALDAGLFFLAYVRDPRSHFIPQQLAMSKHDAMSEYLKVTGSAVFAVPPGVREGGWMGEGLLG